jgi:predicted DsbA family dithiol-disulfide isomerase
MNLNGLNKYLSAVFFLLNLVFAIAVSSCQEIKSNNTVIKPNQKLTKNKEVKMQVEIWSDAMCPFCYIGKRKFETALAQFEHKEIIEVVWKSYQLNPEMKTDTTKNSITALAEHKGISIAESQEMHNYVLEMAANVGLHYNMDKTVSANSFNAHRLTHYAKTQGKQLEAEEKLFEAYFILGKNIDDQNTLTALGESIGLAHDDLVKVLSSNAYADEVRNDIYEAQQVGVRGVPFFVFDRKFAISGTQESEVFLQSLEKAFDYWKTNNPDKSLNLKEGKVCEPEKGCE